MGLTWNVTAVLLPPVKLPRGPIFHPDHLRGQRFWRPPLMADSSHKPLIFGLFRAFPAFFSLIGSALGNGGDGDGGDKWHVAVNLGVAFGEGADCGQVVFLELVSQQAEPPAVKGSVNDIVILSFSPTGKHWPAARRPGWRWCPTLSRAMSFTRRIPILQIRRL